MKATLVGVAVGVLWVGSALAPAPLVAAASEYEVAKWEAGPTALPGARWGHGTVHIPALLNSTSRGHVMVAGGGMVVRIMSRPLFTSTTWMQRRGVLLPRCRSQPAP